MHKFQHQDIQQIHDLNNVPIASIDSRGLIRYVNSAASNLLGLQNGDWGIKSLSDFFQDANSKQILEQELLAGVPVKDRKIRILNSYGNTCFASLSSHILVDVDNIRLTYVFFQNIQRLEKQHNPVTEQQFDLECLLQESRERQARLAAIVDTSDDAIVSKDLQGIITSWNQAARLMFGYTEEEALGTHISLIIPPERIEEEDLIINKIRNGGRIEHFETMRMRKDGKQILVSLSISPIIDEAGQVIGASKIARDISRQKEFEEKLQRYTNHVETLNTIGKLVSESLEMDEILQRVIDASSKIIGSAFGIFIYCPNESLQKQEIQFACAGKTVHLEKSLRTTQGAAFLSSILHNVNIVRSPGPANDPNCNSGFDFLRSISGLSMCSFLAVPVISKSGYVAGQLLYGHHAEYGFNEEHEKLLVGIATLASTALENAILYEKIRNLNAKKDEFIGLASHELKTPITSLKGFLQFISMRMNDGDINKLVVGKALDQTNRLSSLINDILDVTRIETGYLPLSKVPFDFAGMVREIVEQIQYTTRMHHIAFRSHKLSYVILGDRQRLEQVVINLVNNAIKYSPEADLINVIVDEEENYCVLQVQDFGMGISPDQQEFIFSRFYRAEGINTNISGLGIGLYIAKEIIDKHTGELSVQSDIGKGAVFTVKIPVK